MKQIHDTVRQPVITEKTTIQKDITGVYCFRVNVRANKIEIAKAIEELFGVKVADVRTSRVPGKLRRMGRHTGRTPDWKKAWVRLAPGEKEIEYFEAT
jgi:large subunit ribosomal protein L23